ncbi:SIR2 family protein [Ekhidna sp. To15]|uniref:SIR2 family protein n=1 Tax=Ekhidna sp. To15 TaxID=3395267 RepID=UPI003F524F2E
MDTFFGPDINAVNENQLKDIVSSHLDGGTLSVVLGAGASSGFGLKNWVNLVNELMQKTGIDKDIKDGTDPDKLAKDIDSWKFTSETNSSILKEYTQKAKDKLGDSYLETVKDLLYDGVLFDFSTVANNKNLLIAISSLCLRQRRGRVSKVLTYNFDCILEWYLSTIGTDVSIVSLNSLIERDNDVEVLHVHGYLPDKTAKLVGDLGEMTDDIVFSQDEFDDVAYDRGFINKKKRDFYERKFFISIGVSPQTLIRDIKFLLKNVRQEIYESHKLERKNPFGLAVISFGNKDDAQAFNNSRSESNSEYNKILEAGILVHATTHDEVPHFIFKILKNSY